jgi:hypothetical protein
LFASGGLAAQQTGGDAETTSFIGGVGGVYFLAEPGELIIEVEKRDLNRRSTTTELRAILAGPDRRVLQEAVITDDGLPKGSKLGPVKQCRLTTKVDRPGVYALNITVSQDRYGTEMIWGFRSNCRKYLVETARGHKDETHQEPIVLASPGQPGDVCFRPRAGALSVDVSGLPNGTEAPQMFDASGVLLGTLTMSANGQATHVFPAKSKREATPWRLHFPSAQATVNIDGVTRWDKNDHQPNLTCWTPRLSSWFDFLGNRWLLTPYSQTLYGSANETLKANFQVRNDGSKERTIQLALEYPEGSWPAHLSSTQVTLGPNKSSTITLTGPAPAAGQNRVCHVRATPQDGTGFSTYSTILLKGGVAPAAKPLALPLQLKPYQHENEQFGHLPDFPVENQLYFDVRNRPFAGIGDGLAAWQNGKWVETLLGPATKTRVPDFKGDLLSQSSSKVAFDRDNNVYLLAAAGSTVTLLHSTNGGQAFAAYAIPNAEGMSRAYDFEQFSGHNLPDGPPPILRYTRTARDAKLFWRALHDLDLFLPKKVGNRLEIGAPIRLTDRCIGLAVHSGIPSSVVSKGSKVHVVWGEATDPKVPTPGVPVFVATYDRTAQRLSKPALVGHGAPANDIHNTPAITMDSKGYLHVLGGTHGKPFPYAKSLQPNDASQGWTPATPAGDNAGQTYIGLVCGPDDTLYSAFRLWQSGVPPFPASSYATLAYQRKRPGQPWEPPRILVVAPFSEYSVYYHRLTIDQQGRLFLSYDYWSTFWFYRNDHWGRRRTVIMSADGGDTWKLVGTEDLAIKVGR